MGKGETKGDGEQKAPAKGLECRVCGCRRFEVTHTRRMVGAILRRRRCLQCGARITTRERELFG